MNNIELKLKYASLEDAEFLLEIANDSLTRAMSFQQNLITFDEHIKWFEKQIANDIPFYIILCNDALCGYVRFDISKQIPVISTALHKNFRGQGLGKEMLTLACEELFLAKDYDTIHAYIKLENYPSQNIFKQAGFYEVLSFDDTCILMEYKR